MEQNLNISRSYKQYIIVNKGLNMSPGKMAVQVAHASMAPFTHLLTEECRQDGKVICKGEIDKFVWDNWVHGVFTKVCLEAKSELKMQNICTKLAEQGFKEGKDYFKIIDVGTTEFEGIPHWTCIGLMPMDANREDLKTALKGLQLFKD